MIYTVLKENDNETAYLFDLWDEYHSATFCPDIEIICTIELGKLKGKTYQERKACIEDKAIDFSNNAAPGLSYGELAEIQGYFENYGKRYGLLTDFRENAIC